MTFEHNIPTERELSAAADCQKSCFPDERFDQVINSALSEMEAIGVDPARCVFVAKCEGYVSGGLFKRRACGIVATGQFFDSEGMLITSGIFENT
ncbi:MAG TPA: hypothetical protein VJC09_01045 [Candidatus Saccharimonadales bacterium]|nr:hypothetical protein [Candidatus Saccharimonadales bacterium]